MNDLISRQAAIEAIKDLESSDDFGFNEGLICSMNRIAELPSVPPEIRCIANITLTDEQVQEAVEKAKKEILAVQPERKEGRWVRKSNWMWTCSCCGKDDAYAYTADDAFEPTVLQDFFCPHCGAKMGGDAK